ncbi:MAG: hypothetical protein K0R65_206 [Crocinitomicaceae bacterium]|jgi:hypothetical protein|nr:hypothetical protein [Crocinitomicaceae bacterium]
MSYDIHLYSSIVREKHRESKREDFFENSANLSEFTPEQKEALKDRLLSYGYYIESEGDGQIAFGFTNDEGVSALLTSNGLYFSATGEGVFEISMTASEFTDSGELAKYDPQNGGWEEI